MTYAQLPKNANYFEGCWTYEGGSGFDVWKLSNGNLIGESYRISKLGDTTKVENQSIDYVNGAYIYKVKSFNYVEDSVVINENDFVGGKRKFDFVNITESSPYMISYRIRFWNKSKMIIKFYYTPNDKGVKLKLNRRKFEGCMY